MSKIVIIAWREFKQTVVRKVFVLAILGIPIFAVGAGALMIVVMRDHEQPPLVGTIAVVDRSGETIEAARTVFSPDEVAQDQQRQAEKMQAIAEEFGAPMATATPRTRPETLPRSPEPGGAVSAQSTCGSALHSFHGFPRYIAKDLRRLHFNDSESGSAGAFGSRCSRTSSRFRRNASSSVASSPRPVTPSARAVSFSSISLRG